MSRGSLPAAALACALATGCLVSVERVADPRPAFDAARAEALRFQGRPGPAHHVNVLVFDPDDRQLVRVDLPLWLCRKLERRVDWGDDEEDRAARSVRRHVRLEDLERAGLGILVEVEEADGERVLVWLR